MDKNRLLGDAERRALIGIPEERDQLVRLYTFEAGDLALIAERRDDANRLGVALQVALLHHPGMTLAGWLQGGFGLPSALVSFLAETLGLPEDALSAYAGRDLTMTDHARELAQALGVRAPARGDIPFMIAAAAKAAHGTDKGLPIASGVIDALRTAKIPLPSLSTIERARLAGRARARKAAMSALAAILADATNLGLSRMAASSHGVTRDQLIWAKDAHIREENYRAALACLINAHHRLPLAAVWGEGTTSSSDGQFFRGGERVAPGGDVNARYGVDPGFSFYTHVSDQHGPFHVAVLSAAAHEAPYVLDGLLHHGTTLSVREHYTDTGGATDHVFALCALLGLHFCPRLRDFPDRRLSPIAAAAAYPGLGPLLGKRIRSDLIKDHWDDILRLVASLKSGHAISSVMMKKLAAFERQNQLDLALQEIGRIERTLFMLDWLESPALRRRCQAGLNKSEQRHALTQAICTFRQGRIIDRSHEAQLYRASGLNLVIAAIVHWNTTYMAEAVAHLRRNGETTPDALLAHTSPVGWEHIAFSGDFLWDRAAKTTARKALILPIAKAAA
ncbi:MAG: Tn3 family transposase [Methylocystis sp.]|nr:Tn3 family transposase [Methylocystis sp.]MCA3588985.1 Tn3 family transposase [Methylocystis sp.]MCA3593432.1 Tn3 family transposase [Methylocystis sp.]